MEKVKIEGWMLKDGRLLDRAMIRLVRRLGGSPSESSELHRAAQ
jgi:hypothetical protein